MQTEKLLIQTGSFPAPEHIYIEVLPNGPYLVYGTPPLAIETIMPNAAGNSWSYQLGKSFEMKEPTALCRCGESKNKPYCDGSHTKASDVDFAETASFQPLLNNAQRFRGPKLTLADNEKYCAYGRFCDNDQRVWNEVSSSEEKAVQLTEYMVHQCPGGRLLVFDNETNKPIESQVAPKIGILEDAILKISAGYKVDGGIRVQSASGRSYEIRNRQALCRCGQSSNKPFCDGTHASMEFQDGLVKF